MLPDLGEPHSRVGSTLDSHAQGPWIESQLQLSTPSRPSRRTPAKSHNQWAEPSVTYLMYIISSWWLIKFEEPLKLESITSLRKRRQDLKREQTRAKNVEMPKLGAFRRMQIGQHLAWQESFKGYLALIHPEAECDLQGQRHLVRGAINLL